MAVVFLSHRVIQKKADAVVSLHPGLTWLTAAEHEGRGVLMPEWRDTPHSVCGRGWAELSTVHTAGQLRNGYCGGGCCRAATPRGVGNVDGNTRQSLAGAMAAHGSRVGRMTCTPASADVQGPQERALWTARCGSAACSVVITGGVNGVRSHRAARSRLASPDGLRRPSIVRGVRQLRKHRGMAYYHVSIHHFVALSGGYGSIVTLHIWIITSERSAYAV